MNSQAKIISFNLENEAICASAARISTTQGDALEIFGKAKENSRNAALIRKVMESGHESILEHAVFTLALCNVSVLVEQFFIEFRLASFTVKSRRYVDFGKMGYYVPAGLNEEARGAYLSHMDYLFSEYRYFLEEGIPKEDARFLLPYSFLSNFYCTVNARELIHMLQEMRFGRGRDLPELQLLFGQLTEQLEQLFPVLLEDLKGGSPCGEAIEKTLSHPDGEPAEVCAQVALLGCTENAAALLAAAHAVKTGRSADRMNVSELSEEILHSFRPRELEQISASFLVRNVTLSGITHMVRHRMQSILVPPFHRVKPYEYILPDTVRANPELTARYAAVFERNLSAIRELKALGFSEDIYLCLSGNTLDVFTTMNARELMLFFRLRTCRRAQWEVRNIAVDMLNLLRQKTPEIYGKMGPSCFLEGHCPEGKLTCGKFDSVRKSFAAPLAEESPLT